MERSRASFSRRPISTSGWPITPACPIADKVSDDVLRIYFGPRDRQGRTRTAFIDVDADDPSRILRVHDRPVLDLGKPGAFDDSGAMPSCIVNDGGRKYSSTSGGTRASPSRIGTPWASRSATTVA